MLALKVCVLGALELDSENFEARYATFNPSSASLARLIWPVCNLTPGCIKSATGPLIFLPEALKSHTFGTRTRAESEPAIIVEFLGRRPYSTLVVMISSDFILRNLQLGHLTLSHIGIRMSNTLQNRFKLASRGSTTERKRVLKWANWLEIVR